MAKEMIAVDISKTPELLHMAEEVAKSGKPRLLRREHEDLAVLSPARKRGKGRVKTEADWEAFRSAAGSWKDFDLDKFFADLEDSRRLTRPPADL
jgi:hypothetical protein